MNIREVMVSFKKHGLNKKYMLALLNKMREEFASETEDKVLELMDFVEDFCRTDLSIY